MAEMNESVKDDYFASTVKDLRLKCKKLGMNLKGYLKKAELVGILMEYHKNASILDSAIKTAMDSCIVDNNLDTIAPDNNADDSVDASVEKTCGYCLKKSNQEMAMVRVDYLSLHLVYSANNVNEQDQAEESIPFVLSIPEISIPKKCNGICLDCFKENKKVYFSRKHSSASTAATISTTTIDVTIDATIDATVDATLNTIVNNSNSSNTIDGKNYIDASSQTEPSLALFKSHSSTLSSQLPKPISNTVVSSPEKNRVASVVEKTSNTAETSKVETSTVETSTLKTSKRPYPGSILPTHVTTAAIRNSPVRADHGVLMQMNRADSPLLKRFKSSLE